VIARELRLSERTYQRRVRGLMERVNAQTRFQLARQAARRGWLNEPRQLRRDPYPGRIPYRQRTAGTAIVEMLELLCLNAGGLP
jgi:hypothetical protein